MISLIFADILWIFLFSLLFTVIIGYLGFYLYKKHAPTGWNVKTGIYFILIVLTSFFLAFPTFGVFRAKNYVNNIQETCETLLVEYIQEYMPQIEVGRLSTRLLTGKPAVDGFMLTALESADKMLDFKIVIAKKYPYLEKYIPEVTIEKVLEKAGVELKEVTSLDYLVKLISGYCFSAIHDALNSFIYKLLIIFIIITSLFTFLTYRNIQNKKKELISQEDIF